jgi:hypothetical protein
MAQRLAAREIADFVGRMTALSFEHAFNPYADACDQYDKRDAPFIRRRNLSLVLNAAMISGVDSIWVARDLGYRGGRRTGLALTDEIHLTDHAALLGAAPLTRATNGPQVGERTARVIWQVLNSLQRPIFLWNVFPFHPHEPDDPMSNRCHTGEERQLCLPLLSWLIDKLNPRSVVAIGRDAETALSHLNISVCKVRHPSYGGQAEFVSGVRAHYHTAIS